jgi:hypothetical protein
MLELLGNQHLPSRVITARSASYWWMAGVEGTWTARRSLQGIATQVQTPLNARGQFPLDF